MSFPKTDRNFRPQDGRNFPTASLGASVGALLMLAVSSGTPPSAATAAANAAGSGAGNPMGFVGSFGYRGAFASSAVA
jgi:hypothetical protein